MLWSAHFSSEGGVVPAIVRIAVILDAGCLHALGVLLSPCSTEK